MKLLLKELISFLIRKTTIRTNQNRHIGGVSLADKIYHCADDNKEAMAKKGMGVCYEILDGHSFPDKPFKRDIVQSNIRPDICFGTDVFHTPKDLVDCSVDYFASLGYSVGINSPYAGSIVPMRYYQKDKRVSSIMLEVNRRLYMRDGCNERSDGYDEIKKAVQGYIRLLKDWM